MYTTYIIYFKIDISISLVLVKLYKVWLDSLAEVVS
jgi:hypothetical protein